MSKFHIVRVLPLARVSTIETVPRYSEVSTLTARFVRGPKVGGLSQSNLQPKRSGIQSHGLNVIPSFGLTRKSIANCQVTVKICRMSGPTIHEHSAQARAGDLAELIRIVRSIRIALLTTVGRDKEFHTRPVQTLKVDPDGTLWFFTDWTSPKVTELHEDVRVSLGYADLAKNTYVALSGKARLLRDPQKAQELWTLEQRAYYPEGPDDDRLALLRVNILRAEYWIAPGRTSYLIAALRAGVTGKPAGVIGEDHKVK